MPFFGGSPVAAYSPITDIKTPTVVALLADTATTVLNPDAARKGFFVQNTGQTNVVVLFGVSDPTDVVAPFTFKEAYKFTFKPGEAYLFDIPECIPYSATSANGAGELTVKEFI